MLEVADLRVELDTARGPVEALRGLSFGLQRGETLGLIGESGCGKSLTALAVLGLLPAGARASGSVRFQQQPLLGADDAALCRLRGNRIGMVFQEPMTALNPLHTVGDQVAEPLRLHRRLGRSAARAEALRLLDRVQLPRAVERLNAYPHQLSGGQRQRVMIAAALACGPDLLLADEPTSALDATVAQGILALLTELAADSGMALLLISHDLGLVADHVQRVMVMYGGQGVDSGPTTSVFGQQAHPYTRGLFGARPRWNAARVDGLKPRLPTIPGRVPELFDLPFGCAFADRCEQVTEACRAAPPPVVAVAPEHAVRCFLPLLLPPPLGEGGVGASSGDMPRTLPATAASPDSTPLLSVTQLTKTYRLPRTHLFRPDPVIHAVADIGFTLHAGSSLGIVGESGSGKSTLARLVMALETPSAGQVLLQGRDLHALPAAELRAARRDFQMVFQDPYSALDPRHSVARIVGEALPQSTRQAPLTDLERRRRVAEAIDAVGLRAADASKFPHQFSGGQRQRIAIARALITRPKLIVADEPVSALDVSVQAQVLNLLRDLQAEFGLAYLFISHDLAVVAQMCEQVAVMQAGRIVEHGPTDAVFA